MVSSLIDETHNQKIAYRTITNRLDQAERELAEYRANVRERNQPPSDQLSETLNPQSTGAFSTPEISSARSGRYMEENSQRPPQQGMPQRSLIYSGLDVIDTGLQGRRNTPIQSQNGYTERPWSRELEFHRWVAQPPRIELHLLREPFSKRGSMTQ